MRYTLLLLLSACAHAGQIDGSVATSNNEHFTVTLPYSIEHYEAPAPSATPFEMPRNWHHGDDHHGHHGQVPEPSTWALIGCGLVLLAWRRR